MTSCDRVIRRANWSITKSPEALLLKETGGRISLVGMKMNAIPSLPMVVGPPNELLPDYTLRLNIITFDASLQRAFATAGKGPPRPRCSCFCMESTGISFHLGVDAIGLDTDLIGKCEIIKGNSDPLYCTEKFSLPLLVHI
jgi:hypothetical protein